MEELCDKSYEYFNRLSLTMPKDEYNALMKRVFNLSAQRIGRKDKIKVGFVLYDSSIWCGDKLYNCFAQDGRFEVTIFLVQPQTIPRSRLERRRDKESYCLRSRAGHFDFLDALL